MLRLTFKLLLSNSCPIIYTSVSRATASKAIPQTICNSELHQDKNVDLLCAIARTTCFVYPCTAVNFVEEMRCLVAYNRPPDDLARIPLYQKHEPFENLSRQYQQYLYDIVNSTIGQQNSTVAPSQDLSILHKEGFLGFVIKHSWAYKVFSAMPVPPWVIALKTYGFVSPSFVNNLNDIKKHKDQKLDHDIFDAYKDLLLQLKIANPQDHSVQHLKAMIQEPAWDVMKVVGAHKAFQIEALANDEKLHAELAILKSTLQEGQPLATVGISKLACFLCGMILKHHNVKFPGTHGKYYTPEGGWSAVEEFLSDENCCKSICIVLDEYAKKVFRNPDATWTNLTDLSSVRLEAGTDKHKFTVETSYNGPFEEVRDDLCELLGVVDNVL